jgi:hypothetical protein
LWRELIELQASLSLSYSHPIEITLPLPLSFPSRPHSSSPGASPSQRDHSASDPSRQNRTQDSSPPPRHDSLKASVTGHERHTSASDRSKTHPLPGLGMWDLNTAADAHWCTSHLPEHAPWPSGSNPEGNASTGGVGEGRRRSASGLFGHHANPDDGGGGGRRERSSIVWANFDKI